MTTSLARNPVTFLSGGRYSVACQHRPLRCSFWGDARACWGPQGGFGVGRGVTAWTGLQGQIVPMLLFSVLFLASSSLSRLAAQL